MTDSTESRGDEQGDDRTNADASTGVDVDRRRALAALSAGAAGLAGCPSPLGGDDTSAPSGNGGTPGGGGSTPTATTSPTATPAGTSEATETPTDTQTATETATPVGALERCPPGVTFTRPKTAAESDFSGVTHVGVTPAYGDEIQYNPVNPQNTPEVTHTLLFEPLAKFNFLADRWEPAAVADWTHTREALDLVLRE
jgi:hypothetical protein